MNLKRPRCEPWLTFLTIHRHLLLIAEHPPVTLLITLTRAISIKAELL